MLGNPEQKNKLLSGALHTMDEQDSIPSQLFSIQIRNYSMHDFLSMIFQILR